MRGQLGKEREEPAASTKDLRQQAGISRLGHWWDDRQKSDLKGHGSGNKWTASHLRSTRTKPGQEQPYFPQRLEAKCGKGSVVTAEEAAKWGRSGHISLVLLGFNTRKCNPGRI